MIDENSKIIANYLRKAFNDKPTVQRYLAQDNVRYVDIIKTFHSDGISYVGTIGGYRRKMKSPTKEANKIKVELISAVEKKYTEIIAQTLSFLILCLDTDNLFYQPGMIIEDAIPENDITNMRDVYLCNPFLWKNGLPSINILDNIIAFLYVLPITEKEKSFYNSNGANEFEKYLEQKELAYFDLNR